MPYTDQKEYRKFLKGKCIEKEGEPDCGCTEGCNEDSECSCCPPGLVGVYDDKGQHQGCLTPNDAELWYKANFTCLDGYVKLYRNDTTPEFLGCVPSNEFATLYAAVNPPA
jgi:hypothetical protein